MSDEARASERPRLQLKPRDHNAAQAYEAQRARAGSNPFGAAKPREQIIAERLGKTEEEVLKEAVKKERPKLWLNPEQLEQRRQAEARVDEVRAQMGDAEEEERSTLEAELATRENELETLLDKFEALALEAAQRGEIQRPSERRHQHQHTGHGEGEGGGRLGDNRGGFGSGEHGSFDRPARGLYDREGGSGRGGFGGGRGERRQYDRPRTGYGGEGGRESEGRGGHDSRGGRGGYDRVEGGGTYERFPREGSYERYERYSNEGGRGGGERNGGRGQSYERHVGEFEGAPRGGASEPDWVAGGGFTRGGGGTASGGYSRGGGRFDADVPAGAGGYEQGQRGNYKRGGAPEGARGRFVPRGGRSSNPIYEELTNDYVSPYKSNQDRY